LELVRLPIASQSEYTILPDSFTDMQKAAYLLINPLTALCFIDIMKRSNSSSVLHTAGASALGRMFTRLCAKNNFTIINTARK
jgi:NADPH:quinone reductase